MRQPWRWRSARLARQLPAQTVSAACGDLLEEFNARHALVGRCRAEWWLATEISSLGRAYRADRMSAGRSMRSRVVAFWSDLLRDVGYGFRMFRARPGLTAVALLTLALGIGANAAIFGVVDALMLSALPVRAPDQLVLLEWTAKRRPSTRNVSGYGDCPSQGIGTASGCSFSHPFLSGLA